jgi:phosphoglycerate dehydrogenase-like enzyme
VHRAEYRGDPPLIDRFSQGAAGTRRGPQPWRWLVIDHDALADALTHGRLAAAVLDVFDAEPLPQDHPLWRTPNVFVTSHTAALSIPADIAPLFVDNYRRLVRGEPLKYRVDFDLEY